MLIEKHTDRQLANQTGRTLCFDFSEPLGYVDGPNTYQFELSDPVNGLDPLGLADQPAGPTTAPAGANWSATGNVDLIIWTFDPSDGNDDEQKKVMAGAQAYAKKHNTKLVIVKNAKDLVQAVKDRSKDLGTGCPDGHKPLNIVVFGHGFTHTGPESGNGNNTSEIFRWDQARDQLVGVQTDHSDDYGLAELKQGDGGAFFDGSLRGYINDITWGGCLTARDPVDQKIYQMMADATGATVRAFEQQTEESASEDNLEFSTDNPNQPFIFTATPHK